MTKKQYDTVSDIINGCLEYAYEIQLIKENPFLRVKIRKVLFNR